MIRDLLRYCARITKRIPKLDDSGGPALELAGTLPFLLALCYGIIEVGHFGYLRLFLEKAAKDGAGYVITNGSDSATNSGLGIEPNATSGVVTTCTAAMEGTGASSDAICNQIANEMTAVDLFPSAATITWEYIDNPLANSTPSMGSSTVTNSPGNTIAITISYPFVPFLPGFNTIYLPEHTVTFSELLGPIKASAQMTIS